jgi:hypothetical protein
MLRAKPFLLDRHGASSLHDENQFSDDPSSSCAILNKDLKKFPLLFNFSLNFSRIIASDATRSRCTSEAPLRGEAPKRDLRSANVYLRASSRCHDSPFVNGDTSVTSMDAASRWAIVSHTNWISRATSPYDRSGNLSARAERRATHRRGEIPQGGLSRLAVSDRYTPRRVLFAM